MDTSPKSVQNLRSGSRQDQPLHVIEDAYERALAALDDPGAPPLDAVVWMCAHLAAVEHVVQRELTRYLDAPDVSAFRRNAVALERTLRTLEQLASGDALTSRVDGVSVRRAFLDQLQAQADHEHRLLDRLAERLSPAEQSRLVADYERALWHAPTRPHPHAPHGRLLGWLAFHLNGPRDRIMDTLDSRPTPTPHRPRKPIKSSRWGDYFLGVTNPGALREDQHSSADIRQLNAQRGTRQDREAP